MNQARNYKTNSAMADVGPKKPADLKIYDNIRGLGAHWQGSGTFSIENISAHSSWYEEATSISKSSYCTAIFNASSRTAR